MCNYNLLSDIWVSCGSYGVNLNYIKLEPFNKKRVKFEFMWDDNYTFLFRYKYEY